MKVQKFAAGAVFVGAVTAGMVGATPAFAVTAATPAPQPQAGISLSGGGNTVGLGNNTPGVGATSSASKNSISLAISTGLTPGGASAAANGNDLTAVSIDGHTIVSGNHNHGFSALGVSSVDGTSNNVVTVAGASNTDKNSHDNFIVNGGGLVDTDGLQGKDAGEVSVSLCGTSINGQAAHITVKDAGVCSGEN